MAWTNFGRHEKDDEEHGGTNTSIAVKETIIRDGACLDNKVSEIAVKPPLQGGLQSQTSEERPSNSIAVLSSTHDIPPTRSAALVGLAMVSRGGIALIIAQLARGLLVDGVHEEPFAVVIWAILVSTVGGALGVGVLLRHWAKA